MTIRFLSGASNTALRAVAKERGIGLLATPDTGYRGHIQDFPAWAADNACFAKGESFNLEAFLAWLAAFPAEQRATCLFAPAPDVVGDAVATLARSLPVLPMIRALGFPAAFVAQDGLEQTAIPWDAFDVLFIGGSTEWKLGPIARAAVAEAKARGKRVHMGRVNSHKRLAYAQAIGCDSADGTFIAFAPTKNLERVTDWLRKLALQPALELGAAA